MSYQESNDREFYHMLPKGIGFKGVWTKLSTEQLAREFYYNLSEDERKLWDLIFQEVRLGQSDESDKWDELADKISCVLASERESFLKLCGFASNRLNEAEDILYLKASFICKTRLEKQEDILDILLADQDVIFTSNDESYRINTINSENKKVWTPLSDPNNSKCRRELYYGLNAWGTVNKGDIEIYMAILKYISNLASKHHQNIRDWLKTQFPNELPVKECVSILQQMVPQYEVTDEICVQLFYKVLPEYVDKIALYRQEWYRPTNISGAKYQAPARLFISYKARLRRLKRLKNGFKHEIDPILSLDQCRAFSITSEKHMPHKEIAYLIRDFFAQIDIQLKADTKGILEERVAWAMEQNWVPDMLKPVFLTYMTICCKQGITTGTEYLVPTNPPVYDARIGKPPQRYAQLTLLSRLCDMFSIGPDDRLKNWEQYLYWQGKLILSAEEAQFWRTQLGENYESLPAIGFQLCCADYMKDCVPLHLENLLYDRGSKLWNTGYYKFWTANQAIIREQSKQLTQNHPEIVTKYRQRWRHAKDYYFEGKGWLNEVLENQVFIDMSAFDIFSGYNWVELKRLILETELQLAVCSEARTILIKLCERIYRLHPSLFQDIT